MELLLFSDVKKGLINKHYYRLTGGTMQLIVKTKRLEYDLKFKGKYTIIKGDSGNGKTTLCDLLRDRELGDKSIKLECDLPVKLFDSREPTYDIEKYSNMVLVVDEDYMLMRASNVASLLLNSKNYFIIITRKNLDYLPLCVESLYNMMTNGKYHWLEPLYHVSNNRTFNQIELILTEDKESGLDFFKEHFNEIPADSAHSKSEIADYLKYKLDKKYKRILIVYDAAAFGYNIDTLISYVNKRTDIIVSYLDWYSFEHYILTQEPFNIHLTLNDTTYLYESLEQMATDKLSEMISYNKSALPKCLRKYSNCNRCTNVSTCNYKHHQFTTNLCINKIINDMNIY